MLKFLIILIFLQTLSIGGDISPIPSVASYDLEKALLGRKLFYDTRLSKDNTIACISCHQLPGGGADITPVSHGVNGASGALNSPTVLNSVYNFVQFYDGRAATLAEQALGPIENPVEMANKIENVVKMVKHDKYYKKEFSLLYDDDVNAKNILDAIAEFEKALTTPDSRFDQYLRGDKTVLTSQELRGWHRFNELGCISCHNGVNVGGNMYQKSGIIKSIPDTESLGRYNVTKREVDKFVFKVPTLRNIELTAPYFHKGKIKTLDEAIYKMAYFQLGIKLEAKDVQDLEAFLKTLTGKTPEILLKDDQ